MWGASNSSVTVESLACLLVRVGKGREVGETSEQREVTLRCSCWGSRVPARMWRERDTCIGKGLEIGPYTVPQAASLGSSKLEGQIRLSQALSMTVHQLMSGSPRVRT